MDITEYTKVLSTIIGILCIVIGALIKIIWSSKTKKEKELEEQERIGTTELKALINKIEEERKTRDAEYEVKITNVEKSIEIRVSKLEREVYNLKDNYLKRFDEVKDIINNSHIELMKAISEIDKKVDVQKKVCEMVQQQKT
jgi:hypothetical protein